MSDESNTADQLDQVNRADQAADPSLQTEGAGQASELAASAPAVDVRTWTNGELARVDDPASDWHDQVGRVQGQAGELVELVIPGADPIQVPADRLVLVGRL